METIKSIPEHKQIDTWIWSLPKSIVVKTKEIAAIIASWTYYLGLEKKEIIVEEKSK